MKSSLKTPDAARWRELINRHLLGTISNEESVKLEAALAASREAREDFRRRCNIDVALRQQASLQMEAIEPSGKKLTRIRLFPTLTAAAAGLVFGIFCTSMAWAYVVPYASKAMTLLQDSFESGPAPLVSGIPIKAGSWGGDFTEVVGEQQGVKPVSGKKMLRFLRADYEGKINSQGSYVGNVYRIIDLRPFQHDFADGNAVLQVTAGFNTFPFPSEEHYSVSVGMHALSAETALHKSLLSDSVLRTGALAMSEKTLPRLDRDPHTWQKVASELRLPPDTEFLLIHLSVIHATREQQRETFDGHYLDDVSVTLSRRAKLP